MEQSSDKMNHAGNSYGQKMFGFKYQGPGADLGAVHTKIMEVGGGLTSRG